MFNSIQAPQYEYIQYIVLDNVVKKPKITYNTCNESTGDDMLEDENNDIFIPTKEGMEAAKKRLNERLKKGTTKGYNKYFKELMQSFADIRYNG